MNGKSVFIVDDHAILRMGLTSLINAVPDLQVVGDAEDGESAIRGVLDLRPDVVIMDLMMPGMDGGEATRRILSAAPETNILILTSFGSSNALAQALEAGAKGAVLKNIPFPELVEAVQAVATGRRFVSTELERTLKANPPVPRLSTRQDQILREIVRGLSNADIAQLLKISPNMVKAHINALFQKIGAATRAEAVAIALKKHLIK